MKTVTAFDLGAFIAYVEFIKTAVAPSPVPTTAQQQAPATARVPEYAARPSGMSMSEVNQMHDQLARQRVPGTLNMNGQTLNNIRYSANAYGQTGPRNPKFATQYGFYGSDPQGKEVFIGNYGNPNGRFAPQTNRSDLIKYLGSMGSYSPK